MPCRKKVLLEAAVKSAQACDTKRKSGVTYVLLAWFLGVFGAHNFYAGYNEKGLVQLLLTVFSWLLFFLPLTITLVWSFIEMLIVNKDAEGCQFSGQEKVILELRIAAVVWVALVYFMTMGWMFFQYLQIPVVS